MMKPTLSYQPTPPGLAAAMMRMQWWVVGSITARLAIFALLMTLGPLFVAGYVHDLLRWMDVVVGYWLIFALCCAVVGAMLAWSAFRWRGSYFEEEARGWDTGRASSGGEWQLRHEVFTWVFLLDLFHWPFIQFFDALDDLKRLRQSAQADAQVVRSAITALLAASGGQETTHILPAGRASPVGVYLDLYQWAGFSKDGKKMWILSEARKRLEA
jgi:hypothetical protein